MGECLIGDFEKPYKTLRLQAVACDIQAVPLRLRAR
jgi:hypothetical protein